MANDLKSLARNMRRRAKVIETLGNTVAIEGSEAMLKELVSVTPVDTSEALSNWQIGIGSRPPAAIPPYFAGKRGSTRGASSAKAIAEGVNELSFKKPEQVLYISNTAPHIVDLDRGSSTQFAGGFVSRALIVFRLSVKATVKRLLK